MGLTLRIKGKSLFGNKKVDINSLIKSCHLKYGSRDEFAVLDEGKINNNTFVAYNPNAIGRGIYFDCREINSDEIKISINLPTTETEINDFINIIKEIKRQLKKIEILCVEENKRYKLKKLIDKKDEIVKFSLKELNEGCSKNIDKPLIYTLAMWPLKLTNEQRSVFSENKNLKEFERLLNDKQELDVYYAKPRIYENSTNNTIVALYVLTEECESIFPVDGRDFINSREISIDEVKIQFYIFSEGRLIEEIYDYDKFMCEIMKDNISYFDRSHIFIKSLNKNEINDITEIIRN